MAEPALRLCADATTFETTDRSLLAPCANAPVDLLLVRAHDVPEYVRDRVVDLGITGANSSPRRVSRCRRWRSSGSRCTSRPPAESGRAAGRVARARRPPDRDGLPGLHPLLPRAAGDRRGARPGLGSVEAAPRLGLSDAIVDLVSTGSTVSANGLRLLGTLLESQASGSPVRRRWRSGGSS